MFSRMLEKDISINDINQKIQFINIDNDDINGGDDLNFEAMRAANTFSHKISRPQTNLLELP